MYFAGLDSVVVTGLQFMPDMAGVNQASVYIQALAISLPRLFPLRFLSDFIS
jgi:hypothetical protein